MVRITYPQIADEILRTFQVQIGKQIELSNLVSLTSAPIEKVRLTLIEMGKVHAHWYKLVPEDIFGGVPHIRAWVRPEYAFKAEIEQFHEKGGYTNWNYEQGLVHAKQEEDKQLQLKALQLQINITEKQVSDWDKSVVRAKNAERIAWISAIAAVAATLISIFK